MGVYVPNLQKPTDCGECQIGDMINCTLWKESHCVPPDECPLIEVKTPHGPLKDASQIIKRMEDYSVGYYDVYVRNAPTVIESEK